MKNNNFRTDTTVPVKKDFLNRIGALFGAAILLTGISSFAGIWLMVAGIGQQIWEDIGVASFVWRAFETAMVVLVLVSLIKMAIDEKPFSRTVTWCIRLIGILFVAASVVMPRLDGYSSSGFEILNLNGKAPLIDGAILLIGLLLIILGSIVMAGFEMQKEMDEIL